MPTWLNGPGFRAAVHSDDELTLVCLEERVPSDVETEKGWACLRTIGPFPFDATGIVQALVEPLSDGGIGVFVVCTFDGEHILVPSCEVEKATQVLQAAGHLVLGGQIE
nr:ACT domain-containing protein [Shimia sp. R11_0]